VVSVFIVPKEQDHMTGFRHGPNISSHTSLPEPTSLTHELIKPAIKLVEQLYENGRTYKKAGVMLSGIVPDNSIQGNLFVPHAENQNRFLMNTIDNINFALRDDSVKIRVGGNDKGLEDETAAALRKAHHQVGRAGRSQIGLGAWRSEPFQASQPAIRGTGPTSGHPWRREPFRASRPRRPAATGAHPKKILNIFKISGSLIRLPDSWMTF
jgi:hypothetical protein